MTDSEAPASTGPGAEIIRASWVGTAVFTITAVAADFVTALKPVAFAVSVALFVAGCVVFLLAFFRAVGRSRTDNISVTNLYFLAGSAPASVRRSLLASLAVQVVVAIITAAIRPYTSLAAGILAPVYGLGLCGLWAARHGTFHPR
jgi:hypothetical protein